MITKRMKIHIIEYENGSCIVRVKKYKFWPILLEKYEHAFADRAKANSWVMAEIKVWGESYELNITHD